MVQALDCSSGDIGGRYVDITETIRREASALGPSELQISPTFTLFQAISAFELGNPKMDTGAHYISLDDELKRSYRVETPDQLAVLIDHLLCAEMAWHEGSTLVQTVFSCLKVEEILVHVTKLRGHSLSSDESQAIQSYLDSLFNIRLWEDVLNIYIVVLLKCCSLTNSIMTNNSTVIALDEEFHTSTCEFYLFESSPSDVFLRLAEAAGKYCSEHKSVVKRLHLRSHWLQTLRRGIMKKDAHLSQALEALGQCYSDEQLETRATWKERDEQAASIFTTGIQTRATQFCLSRPLVTMSLRKAAAQLKLLLESIKSLSGTLYQVSTATHLMNAFVRFSVDECSSLPLPRALLKSLVGENDMLSMSVKTWPLKDITEMTFPGLCRTKLSKSARKSVDAFLSHAAFCFCETLTTLCQHRTRQRESLIYATSYWDSLQANAEQVDEVLIQQKCSRTLLSVGGQTTYAFELTEWTLFHKMQCMISTGLMAIELDLALPWEYGFWYWYVSLLSKRILDLITRVEIYYQQHSISKDDIGYSVHALRRVYYESVYNISKVAYVVYAVLQQRNALPSGPQTQLSRPDLVFGLRLQPFEEVGVPESPTYQEFRSALNSIGEHSLRGCERDIMVAKTHVCTWQAMGSEYPGATEFMRSVEGFSVLLADLEKKTGTVTIVRKGYSRYFPVPTLVRKEDKAE